MGGSRARLLDAAGTVVGDRTLDQVATFRLRPRLSAVLIAVQGVLVVLILTGNGWAFAALAVAWLTGYLVNRTYSVAIGPQSAYGLEHSRFGFSLTGRYDILDSGTIAHVSNLRWQVSEHDVWAWGDGRRLLEHLAARPA